MAVGMEASNADVLDKIPMQIMMIPAHWTTERDPTFVKETAAIFSE